MSELFIEAKIENLNSVLEFVGKRLEEIQCPPKTQTQITIAVEEIFVNIAYYAYNPILGAATILVSVKDNVVIEFQDNGRPYNPLEKEDPDITKSIQEREVGGLGIFMVKNIMDTVEYRHEENKNILTIKKKVL
jgi:anti-sigma regulatory factor (Ser/Thr protein kinase)